MGPPADPVSVGLAYSINAAKQFSVPEAKLSFGFNKLPLNGLPKVLRSNIPEEKLFTVIKGPIIELKRTYAPPVEEEFEEPEDEVVDQELPAPYLSYPELGYGPAAIKNPKFKNVVVDPIAVELPSGKRDYSCGFKPGQITQNGALPVDPYFGGLGCGLNPGQIPPNPNPYSLEGDLNEDCL